MAAKNAKIGGIPKLSFFAILAGLGHCVFALKIKKA
jgi:hypothetical protein